MVSIKEPVKEPRSRNEGHCLWLWLSDGYVVGCVSVVLSVFSILVCTTAVPLLFTRIDAINQRLTNDMNSFKTSSDEIWTRIKVLKDTFRGKRSYHNQPHAAAYRYEGGHGGAQFAGNFQSHSSGFIPFPFQQYDLHQPQQHGYGDQGTKLFVNGGPLPEKHYTGNFPQAGDPDGYIPPVGFHAPLYPDAPPNTSPEGVGEVEYGHFKEPTGPCAHARGARGAIGYPGTNGLDGEPGPNGYQGRPGNERYEADEQGCQICPMGRQGDPGLRGDVGIQGSPGYKGAPGNPGLYGEPGRLAGRQGPMGAPGYDGNPGYPGPPGEDRPGGVGYPGPPGYIGDRGRPGDRGVPGNANYETYPGLPGLKGSYGLKGLPGLPGLEGSPGLPGPPGYETHYCPCPGRSGSGSLYPPPNPPPVPYGAGPRVPPPPTTGGSQYGGARVPPPPTTGTGQYGGARVPPPPTINVNPPPQPSGYLNSRHGNAQYGRRAQ